MNPKVMQVAATLGAVAVLLVCGNQYRRNQERREKIAECANVLTDMIQEIETTVLDLGYLNDNRNEAEIRNYFAYTKLALDLADYSVMETLGQTINGIQCCDLDTAFGSDYFGIAVQTMEEWPDPWEKPYRFYYLIPAEGEMYRIILASAGPDKKWSPAAGQAYTAGEIQDDIVLMAEPIQWK